ncbi:hypothetical protein KZ829_39385 [Actinoplanes hulinensis]|uniref:Uncharacterized protein n=1 Tax=Actinoplanes hulinensis TaxID=1144547 RepID=A0ABS7BG54_9ACTN|nr:hypothetical protein [Actinoplanes hulinensis]MBW6439807.1 hypothetical protein [Actinoplanes hulinensis]
MGAFPGQANGCFPDLSAVQTDGRTFNGPRWAGVNDPTGEVPRAVAVRGGVDVGLDGMAQPDQRAAQQLRDLHLRHADLRPGHEQQPDDGLLADRQPGRQITINDRVGQLMVDPPMAASP